MIPPASASPSRPAPPPPLPAGMPLLRLGFRPFYLGAALFAALAIPLWIAMFLGWTAVQPAVPPMLWHAHEMLFGFAVAVIVGFLLTAGKAWTGVPTPRGAALGALAALWLAARLAAVAAPYAVYAVLDLVLLPVVAAIFARVLYLGRNFRNLPLAAILLLLALANACFHLSVAGLVDLSPLAPLHAALGMIIVIETVIGGRVIPAFTASANFGLVLRPRPVLAWSALVATVLALLLWVVAPPNGWSAAVLFAAAALQWLRQATWAPATTLRKPILWILHLSYAWIGAGLLLLGLAQLGWMSGSAGLHALAVGATGGLIIGMMTRTARGHTGRPLQVGRAELAAYGLVMGAAVLRVLLPLLAPGWLTVALLGSALAWALAFAVYLWIHGPWLLQARIDDKDG